VVIKDLNGAFSIPSSSAVDQQVAAIQAQAQVQQSGVAAVDPTGAASYQSSLDSLNQGIGQSSPLAQNQSSVANLLALASNATAAVQAYQSGISSSSTQYAYTVGLIASLQSIANLVQNGEPVTTQSSQGGELFTVAAFQSGDVTQAFNYASANGFVQPIIGATAMQIVIPPTQQAA
jgi:hypothetical protein